MQNANDTPTPYRPTGAEPAGLSREGGLRPARTFDPDKLFGGFTTQDMIAGVFIVLMILGPLAMAPHH